MVCPGKPCRAVLHVSKGTPSPLRPRSHAARGPTFGCVVYVGHAAVLQLHGLAIFEGERLCRESNSGPPLQPVATEGTWGCRASLPPGCRAPHLSVSSPGECTQWSRPPAGSPALQVASPLETWRQRSGPGWRGPSACFASFGRCPLESLCPCLCLVGTFPPSPPLEP